MKKQHYKKEKMNFNDARRILVHYFKVTSEYQKWFWWMLVTYGIGTIFAEVVALILYKDIIDTISGEEPTVVWRTVMILGLVYLTYFIFNRLGDLGIVRYIVPGHTKLSRYAFLEIQKHPHSFFTDRFVGGLTSQIKRYTDAFNSLVEGIVYNYWSSFISITGITVALFFFSWQVGILFLLTLVCLITLAIPMVRKRMQYDEESGQASSRISGQYSDVLTNILNVKLFTGSDLEKELFHFLTQEHAQKEQASWWTWILTGSLQQALMLSFRYGIFIFALYLWIQGEITVGTIVLVVGYFQALFGIIWQFIRGTSGMLRDLANAKEMLDQLELPVNLLDAPGAKPLVLSQGTIAFEEVDFFYGEGEAEKVFHNLSFTLKPGEHIGLVGPSGGGKTTVTKLLLRLMDPVSGRIAIDGQDIKSVTQESLHQAVSYVSQDPTLFHRSLFDNIAYGKPDATKEEVIAAAKKAHAHEFIEKLEKGYGTEVGERGIKLSGGQRQRIAIARAILKDAPILVMDEATSALDTISEKAIRDSLDAMMENKTVLIIAHRLSTVEKLDRIIVLDKNGAIREQGTHQELLAKNDLYATLWNHQVGGFLSEEKEK